MIRLVTIYVLLTCSLMMFGCGGDANEDLIQNGPTCSDGIRNGNEDGVDCGGTSCDPCSQPPANAPKCTDGILNGDETDVDCGGPTCSACEVPLPETCSDGIKNQDETDIDCGGLCSQACANGKTCTGDSDCTNNSCISNVCQGNSCSNGVQDGTETDIDCGGSECGPCVDNKACMSGNDCLSNICDLGVCVSASCDDSLQNQDETDADCGGSCPIACINGQGCVNNNDCTSNYCNLGTCESAPITDVCVSQTQIPLTECRALEALFNETGGTTSWVANAGWMGTNTPCDWYGIYCEPDGSQQHVVSVGLWANGLVGALPSQLGDLAFLNDIDLSYNDVTSIPSQMMQLDVLLVLDVSYNATLTSLPANIGDMAGTLSDLIASGCGLSTLPAALTGMYALETLKLDRNELSLTVSDDWSNGLSNLNTLQLKCNDSISVTSSAQSWLNNLDPDYFRTDGDSACQ